MGRVYDDQGHRTVVMDTEKRGVRVVVAYSPLDDEWIAHLYVQRDKEAEVKIDFEGGMRPTKEEAIEVAFGLADHLE